MASYGQSCIFFVFAYSETRNRRKEELIIKHSFKSHLLRLDVISIIHYLIDLRALLLIYTFWLCLRESYQGLVYLCAPWTCLWCGFQPARSSSSSEDSCSKVWSSGTSEHTSASHVECVCASKWQAALRSRNESLFLVPARSSSLAVLTSEIRALSKS